MTSKLKCPVCNHELYQTASEPATYCCLYKDCQSDFKFAGSKELWQALIQAKQDLEFFKEEQNRAATALIERTKELDKCQKDLKIATKALKEIKKVCDGCRWCDLNLYDPTPSDGRRIAETTNKALETIGKHNE